MWLGRSHASKVVPVISTGSFSLDMALGIGGLPKVLAYDCQLIFHVSSIYTVILFF